MKKISIFLAQDSNEIKLFLKEEKDKEFDYVLPLDLDALIYCELKKLHYLNPLLYISKNFHKDTIIELKKFFFLKKNNKFESDSIKTEIMQYFRFRFTSICFVYNLISNIKKNYKIKKIIVSGDSVFYFPRDIRNRYLYDIIYFFFKNIKIYKLRKLSIFNFKKNIYKYKIDKSLNRNSIFLLNLGYNFYRIVLSFFFKKKIYLNSLKNNSLIYYKLSLFQKLKFKFYNFFGLKIIKLKKIKKTNKIIQIEKIKILYKGKNLSKLMNKENNLIKYYYNDLYQKYLCFKNFFKSNKPDYIFSNSAIGIEGLILDAAFINKIKTVNIPHGTLSPSYNQFDEIYKRIISEGVFYNKANYFVSQTKIASKFLNEQKFNGVEIKGNLIFGKINKVSSNLKSNQILYAVTNKNFHNVQLLGVEAFYEFFANLKIFNEDNFFRKFKFMVQLHPSIHNLKETLEKVFKNLAFSSNNLNKNIANSFVVISFSSTCIEEALCSKVPVILFDQWKRYEHFKIQAKKNLKNKPLIYIKEINSLKKNINLLNKNTNFKFHDFLYADNLYKNIQSIFN